MVVALKLSEVIDLFLSEKRDEKFYDSSLITYKRKIGVFIEFLKIECNVTDSYFIDFLTGLRKETFIKSIEYYATNYNVRFKATVDNYITVVKSFFDFIGDDKIGIRTELFDSTYNLKQMMELANAEVKRLGLDKSDQKSPITKTSYKELKAHCDKILEQPVESVLHFKENKYNGSYTNYLSAIITKLVMFSGIKSKTICKILLSDYDYLLNKIKINGYWLHLPDIISKQLKNYLYLRNQIEKRFVSSELLFLDKSGNSVGTAYSSIFIVMSQTLGMQKAECIAKFTIIQFIAAGMKPSYILSLTGYAHDTYLHCYEIFEEESIGQISLITKTREIDSKIRLTEFFDEL